MTTVQRSDQMAWTPLGMRMGFTSQQPQREEILAAIDRMNWVHTTGRPPELDGRAVRVLVNALFHHRRSQLRQVGIAELDGDRQLIGLQDSLGARSYVLDLDSEAIYVLVEYPDLVTIAQQRRVA